MDNKSIWCEEVNTTMLGTEDKKLLLSWGYTEDDFSQITEAIHKNKTEYTMDGIPIDREEAIRLLGREEYLSGIARSAFHFTAVRKTSSGKAVCFDSSCLSNKRCRNNYVNKKGAL